MTQVDTFSEKVFNMANALILIEDDESQQRLVQLRLKMAGITSNVLMANTLEDVVNHIEESDTRFLLVDQDLGGALLGSAVVQAVREKHNGRSVIIAVTSSTDPNDQERFKQAGADGFVPKANFADLVPGLKYLLSGRKMPKEFTQFMEPPLGFWTPRIIDIEEE